MNDGNGTFSTSLSVGSTKSDGVALGDLDGDGDLDAFVANRQQPNRVWLNGGSANFTDSGQLLSNGFSLGVDLGDLDGDGDLDAFVTNVNQGDRVWVNNGSGVFSDSGQSLGSDAARRIALGDVDNDGDLDAFAANAVGADRVWLNDGSGTFSLGQSLAGTSNSKGVALGDTDGDGDLDAFVAANGFPNGESSQLWLSSTVVGNQPQGSLPSGLIHLWSGEGNAFDSVSGAHGTLGATTAFGTGLNGQEFSFDGLHSSIVNPLPVNINPRALPQMTMRMLVNVRSVSFSGASLVLERQLV